MQLRSMGLTSSRRIHAGRDKRDRIGKSRDKEGCGLRCLGWAELCNSCRDLLLTA